MRLGSEKSDLACPHLMSLPHSGQMRCFGLTKRENLHLGQMSRSSEPLSGHGPDLGKWAVMFFSKSDKEDFRMASNFSNASD